MGAALAGGIAAYIVSEFGWRAAFLPPAVIALIAIYVRVMCPESPYWVRTKDRRDRIKARVAAKQIVSAEDQAWISKADKLGRRLGFAFMPLQATIFMTWWIFATDKSTLFWVGIVWGWGFLGVWFYSPEHAGKELDEISA